MLAQAILGKKLRNNNNDFRNFNHLPLSIRGGSRGRVQGLRTPPSPPPLEMTCGFLIQLVFYVVYYWCWSRARDECTPSKKKSWIRPCQCSCCVRQRSFTVVVPLRRRIAWLHTCSPETALKPIAPWKKKKKTFLQMNISVNSLQRKNVLKFFTRWRGWVYSVGLENRLSRYRAPWWWSFENVRVFLFSF